jgi:hypothetical protein
MPGRGGGVTITLVATPDPDEEPCVHYWQATDRNEDVIVCRYCRTTWSLDDGPGDAP